MQEWVSTENCQFENQFLSYCSFLFYLSLSLSRFLSLSFPSHMNARIEDQCNSAVTAKPHLPLLPTEKLEQWTSKNVRERCTSLAGTVVVVAVVNAAAVVVVVVQIVVRQKKVFLHVRSPKYISFGTKFTIHEFLFTSLFFLVPIMSSDSQTALRNNLGQIFPMTVFPLNQFQKLWVKKCMHSNSATAINYFVNVLMWKILFLIVTLLSPIITKAFSNISHFDYIFHSGQWSRDLQFLSINFELNYSYSSFDTKSFNDMLGFGEPTKI